MTAAPPVFLPAGGHRFDRLEHHIGQADVAKLFVGEVIGCLCQARRGAAQTEETDEEELPHKGESSVTPRSRQSGSGEIRSQRSEVRGQKSEVRGRRLVQIRNSNLRN